MRLLHAWVAVLALIATSVGAQPADRRNFKPSSLPQMVAEMNAALVGLPVGKPAIYFENGADVRREVKATYTGQSRELTGSEKAFILQFTTQRQVPNFAKLFEKAYLFRADGKDYWIPVQPMISQYFADEMKPGDTASLDLLEAGGVIQSPGDTYWCFLLLAYTAGS